MKPRREFLKKLGLSPLLLPLTSGLTSLAAPSDQLKTARRLIVMFSPNGTVPEAFWPSTTGRNWELPPILKPLESYREQMLFLKGVANQVRGDGDSHMRGMSCLLTGKELFPGNIQGGSHTPAGWSSGISIDQELKNAFQASEADRTRFGSLEFGVVVPDRADPWTRMCYAGPNLPVAPISSPYQMFDKMYGQMKDRATLASILDPLHRDLDKLRKRVPAEDRTLLDRQAELIREMERDIADSSRQKLLHPAPELPPGLRDDNDRMPELSRMQIDLLVNGFANDMARVATLQYTNSVGQAKMHWLDIKESHHTLSHDPDKQTESVEKLTRINTWFAGELAYLMQRLADTPEPTGDGKLLDHTLVIWTNELGKGNSHTLKDIPFLLLGEGCGFRMGLSRRYDQVAHNRLWLAVAQGMGHPLETFGNPKLCEGGALDLVADLPEPEPAPVPPVDPKSTAPVPMPS